MTLGSLFSGIGGLDLGLERAGMRVVWQVENNPFCRKVLAKHWPDVPCYEDVKTLTGEELEPVDVICGGFPCQPVSVAGTQKGTDDERWLWPEFNRLIRILRPRYAILENVPGLFTVQHGQIFGDILRDLAEGGYDAEWDRLPAASVGAPHLRQRVFIIATRQEMADAETERHQGIDSPHRTDGDGVEGGARQNGDELRGEALGRGGSRRARAKAVADAGRLTPRTEGNRPGGERLDGASERVGANEGHGPPDSHETVADADRTGPQGRELLPQRRVERVTGAGGLGCRFFDAPIGGEWFAEPNVGRVAHGVPSRVDRLKCLGNAVVPQCAEWIGRQLQKTAPLQ